MFVGLTFSKKSDLGFHWSIQSLRSDPTAMQPDSDIDHEPDVKFEPDSPPSSPKLSLSHSVNAIWSWDPNPSWTSNLRNESSSLNSINSDSKPTKQRLMPKSYQTRCDSYPNI